MYSWAVSIASGKEFVILESEFLLFYVCHDVTARLLYTITIYFTIFLPSRVFAEKAVLKYSIVAESKLGSWTKNLILKSLYSHVLLFSWKENFAEINEKCVKSHLELSYRQWHVCVDYWEIFSHLFIRLPVR